MSRPAL